MTSPWFTLGLLLVQSWLWSPLAPRCNHKWEAVTTVCQSMKTELDNGLKMESNSKMNNQESTLMQLSFYVMSSDMRQ